LGTARARDASRPGRDRSSCTTPCPICRRLRGSRSRQCRSLAAIELRCTCVQLSRFASPASVARLARSVMIAVTVLRWCALGATSRFFNSFKLGVIVWVISPGISFRRAAVEVSRRVTWRKDRHRQKNEDECRDPFAPGECLLDTEKLAQGTETCALWPSIDKGAICGRSVSWGPSSFC